MKKLMLLALVCVMVPAVAGAQTPKSVPPVPAVPVVAPTPKVMPAIVIPDLAGLSALDAQDLRLRAMEAEMQAEAMAQTLSGTRTEALTEATRRAMDEARMKMDELRITRPMLYDLDMTQTFASTWSNDNERSVYERGQSALSQRQYEQAITRFDQAIALKGTRTDGALYWKAWAQYKLGRSSDATATLAELQKSFKDSKYSSDAKVLEAEVKKSAGQAMRPENADDEDLKLLAIQSLSNSDPERAIPLLQGVLNSAGSLKLKDRALFVLASSSQPQAHTMLVNIAKGGNPDLQLKAIRYLGISARSSKNSSTSSTSQTELADIYASATNDDVKRAILQTWGSSGNRMALVSAIGGTQVIDLRREGINQLGSAQAGPELWAMYQKETNKELKMQILSTLASMGAYDKVIEVAKTEKEADIRNRAIRSLGSMKADRSGAALMEIYAAASDTDAKTAVIQGLANQNNADALITLARKETNVDLKRRMVQTLTSSSMAKNKAVQDFLVEFIK
jgi:tetratricopeptide (TPR) repeat protein